jgi:hypothetical protein
MPQDAFTPIASDRSRSARRDLTGSLANAAAALEISARNGLGMARSGAAWISARTRRHPLIALGSVAAVAFALGRAGRKTR